MKGLLICSGVNKRPIPLSLEFPVSKVMSTHIDDYGLVP